MHACAHVCLCTCILTSSKGRTPMKVDTGMALAHWEIQPVLIRPFLIIQSIYLVFGLL